MTTLERLELNQARLDRYLSQLKGWLTPIFEQEDINKSDQAARRSVMRLRRIVEYANAMILDLKALHPGAKDE